MPRNLSTVPLLLVLWSAATLAPLPAAAGEPDGATLDLMNGYWRYHFTFAPSRVSPAGLANLGTDARARRLRRRTYFDLGWYAGHGTSTELAYLIRSAPPPADWTQPDFNDSGWARHKRPFMTGPGASTLGLAVGLACFRASALVDDPDQVRGLKLDLTYRGGVVVYVNGREIARRHLPKGELKPDTHGEDYPLEAYVLPPTDVVPRGNQQRPLPELWSDVFPGPKGGDWAWVRDQFRANPKAFKVPAADVVNYYRQGCGRWTFTRQEYEKVRDLRDRKLGPVAIPKGLLRKGANVVAIEVHRSDLNPVIHDRKRLGSHNGWGYFGGVVWMHGLLKYAKLTAAGPGGIRAEARPPGIQVWTEDIHRRCFSPEFGPIGRAPAPLRLVGARNGSYSAQAVLGASGPLGGVRTSVKELVHAGGSKIPAGAVVIRYGVPLPVARFADLGVGRGSPRLGERNPARLPAVRRAVQTYGSGEAGKDFKSLIQTIAFFDQLATSAPKTVPANSCFPAWATVKVPKGARPGEYRGELTITAGGEAANVPIKLWVMDWMLPDPLDFETVMALEQSPYGVAAHYKVELWSDEHLRLMENSFRLLAEIGNDFLVIPVLTGSEFGNREDSMIRWVRGAKGAWDCDFSVFDRYLKLACKYLKPRCVCFVVGHPTDNSLFVKPRVVVKQGDKLSLLDVPTPGTDEAKAFWAPLVAGLKKRLADRDLKGAMHWGFYWDTFDHRRTGGYCAKTQRMLAELAPGVGWVRGCHSPRGLGKDGFTFVSSIYYLRSCHHRDRATGQLRIISRKGWKNPMLHLVLPRVVNTVITVEGTSPPLCYRLAPERAIVHGARGVARIGVDYWAGAYQAGWRGGVQVGMPVTAVLWPGQNGADSGARFECLKEGVQETEARIFLEKKLEGKAADGPDAGAAQAVLDRRIQETLHIPPAYSEPRVSEYYGGWQERSWDLYTAAAKAAGGRGPSAEEKARFFGQGIGSRRVTNRSERR